MNENLNLIEILKDCPKGTKLYSMIHGDVEFVRVSQFAEYPIEVKLSDNSFDSFTKDGRIIAEYSGECILFPSREERDCSKFKPKKDGLVPPCEFKDGDILSYQNERLSHRTIYIYRYHKRFNN